MSDTKEARLRTVEAAACLGCNGLSDDLSLVVDGDRIVEVVGTCDPGAGLYKVGREVVAGSPTISGVPASLEDAIGRAAELLGSARAPMVWGLVGMTVEAQRAAVAVADRIGAVLGIEGSGRSLRRATQRVGRVGATLGEVRDRADVIVSVGWSDLMHPCRRFGDRILGPGRFVPDGRRGRTIIQVGEWIERAGSQVDVDLRVRFAKARAASFFHALRASIRGVALDPDRVERSTGVDLETLTDLAGRLRAARYGAIFLEEMRSEPAAGAILALVRDLNASTRFVVLGSSRGEANRAGAVSVVAWQAGASDDVDFGPGYPRSVPGDGALERLRRGEIDTALIVGGHEDASYSPMREALKAIPRVVIGPAGWMARGNPSVAPGLLGWFLEEADVTITTAVPGIDEGGTICRTDGVMLPLRAPFPGRRVAMVEVLRRIEGCLKDMGR